MGPGEWEKMKQMGWQYERNERRWRPFLPWTHHPRPQTSLTPLTSRARRVAPRAARRAVGAPRRGRRRAVGAGRAPKVALHVPRGRRLGGVAKPWPAPALPAPLHHGRHKLHLRPLLGHAGLAKVKVDVAHSRDDLVDGGRVGLAGGAQEVVDLAVVVKAAAGAPVQAGAGVGEGEACHADHRGQADQRRREHPRTTVAAQHLFAKRGGDGLLLASCQVCCFVAALDEEERMRGG